MTIRHTLRQGHDKTRFLETTHYTSNGVTYAYVLLDREDFMRSGHGCPLNERFREELGRCAHAIRIWFGLRGADVSLFGNGDMRPSLCVPCSEEQNVVEALRLAELSDDQSRLIAIRERFETAVAQVEAWFEAGSKRTLTQGVDFFCGPSRMLKILRLWAKQSGLKLNGGIEGEQISIAPERPYQRLIARAQKKGRSLPPPR